MGIIAAAALLSTFVASNAFAAGTGTDQFSTQTSIQSNPQENNFQTNMQTNSQGNLQNQANIMNILPPQVNPQGVIQPSMQVTSP